MPELVMFWMKECGKATLSCLKEYMHFKKSACYKWILEQHVVLQAQSPALQVV